MAALNKVRVQLLDPTTGAVVEEVDILTSADSVTFADGETFQQKLNLGKLKGDKGDTGAQGIQGPKGDKGDPGINPIWHFFNTATAPTTTLGVIGDWAVNTNGQTYEKTGTTTWTARANIKGTTGATGAQGIQGPKGDKGDPGDGVKFGTTYATAVATKVFFKKI